MHVELVLGMRRRWQIHPVGPFLFVFRKSIGVRQYDRHWTEAILVELLQICSDNRLIYERLCWRSCARLGQTEFTWHFENSHGFS
jgi:hypothetical protein